MYYVAVCSDCGKAQNCLVRFPERYVFKCRRCGKMRKLIIKKKIGFNVNVIGATNDGKVAVELCKKYNTPKEL